MQVSHETQLRMAWYPVKGKLVMAGDIFEERRFRLAADRGDVEFHLNAPYAGEISGIDYPLCSFTVAFQEIAATGEFNNIPQGEGRRAYHLIIPPDHRRKSVAERTAHNPHIHPVQPDIPSQKIAGYRFHGNHVFGKPGSPDRKRTDVCPDIDDNIVLPNIVKAVFRNLRYLAVTGRMPQELYLVISHEIRAVVIWLAVHSHMDHAEPAPPLYGMAPAQYPAWMLYRKDTGWVVTMFSTN